MTTLQAIVVTVKHGVPLTVNVNQALLAVTHVSKTLSKNNPGDKVLILVTVDKMIVLERIEPVICHKPKACFRHHQNHLEITTNTASLKLTKDNISLETTANNRLLFQNELSITGNRLYVCSHKKNLNLSAQSLQIKTKG